MKKNESGWICGSVYLKLRSTISKPMQQYCSNYREYYLGISIAWQLQKNDLLNTRCENHLHFPFNVSNKELSCCPRRSNNTQALWTFKKKWIFNLFYMWINHQILAWPSLMVLKLLLLFLQPSAWCQNRDIWYTVTSSQMVFPSAKSRERHGSPEQNQ